MAQKKLSLILVLLLTGLKTFSQTYSIDYTFERSHNSRIKQNKKYGLIDTNKTILILPIYEEVRDFHYGLAKVIKNDKVGFVNAKAEEIIPCVYDRDEQIITGAVVNYVVNTKGEITTVTVGTEESRLGFNEGLVCVIKSGRYGFINKNNETIIPFQYDGADNFYDSIAIIKQKDKYGAIDRTGKIVIPLEYDLLVWEMGKNYPDLYTRKNGRTYNMDKDQKEVKY